MTKAARVALRGRLKEMMLLTGGQASADSSTAGQCGSVGTVQGGDRAHGGGAAQGRAAGERSAAGERERETPSCSLLGCVLYSVCVSYGPVLRNVLDILVCNILNSNYRLSHITRWLINQHKVRSLWYCTLGWILNGLLCGLGVGRKAQTLCSR